MIRPQTHVSHVSVAFSIVLNVIVEGITTNSTM